MNKMGRVSSLEDTRRTPPGGHPGRHLGGHPGENPWRTPWTTPRCVDKVWRIVISSPVSFLNSGTSRSTRGGSVWEDRERGPAPLYYYKYRLICSGSVYCTSLYKEHKEGFRLTLVVFFSEVVTMG
jgi:hypothetical protein